MQLQVQLSQRSWSALYAMHLQAACIMLLLPFQQITIPCLLRACRSGHWVYAILLAMPTSKLVAITFAYATQSAIMRACSLQEVADMRARAGTPVGQAERTRLASLGLHA